MNTLLVNYLKNLIEICGYEVMVNKSAEEYYNLIVQNTRKNSEGIRIGFVDFRLPGKNGLEFITFLFENNHQQIARHLVLMKDDSSNSTLIEQSPYADQIQIIKKPYYPHTIMELIKRHEERHYKM
ncbi:MAG: hypothetical protein ACMUJM_07765 [bacterium]